MLTTSPPTDLKKSYSGKKHQKHRATNSKVAHKRNTAKLQVNNFLDTQLELTATDESAAVRVKDEINSVEEARREQ